MRGDFFKSPFYSIFQHIVPVVLRLSTDLELVARELYRPLIMQMICLFTNNSIYENPDTMSLLTALLDAVSDPEDGVLRDFAGDCLASFVRYSIKQSAAKNLKENPGNVKSLLKRLYAFFQHPSASKRMGAALTFNRIYRLLREETALMDAFLFELLDKLLLSLSPCTQRSAWPWLAGNGCGSCTPLPTDSPCHGAALSYGKLPPSKAATAPPDGLASPRGLAVPWRLRERSRIMLTCAWISLRTL